MKGDSVPFHGPAIREYARSTSGFGSLYVFCSIEIAEERPGITGMTSRRWDDLAIERKTVVESGSWRDRTPKTGDILDPDWKIHSQCGRTENSN